jgi:UDP-galactopyranose mutase
VTRAASSIRRLRRTYRYLDMEVTIAEALTAADGILEAVEGHMGIPSLFVDA